MSEIAEDAVPDEHCASYYRNPAFPHGVSYRCPVGLYSDSLFFNGFLADVCGR